jgi:hypothetical protein
LPEAGNGESPRGALTPQQTRKPEQGRPKPENAEAHPFALTSAQDLFGKLRETPAGEDPAFWPVHVLNEINFYILHRDYPGNDRPGIWGISAREIGEKYAPIQENIRKVKTAYEILAYPHCKDWGRRDNIEDELESDRRAFERDQVELSDAELKILSNLTAARNIPFNPEKRVYKYSEVLHPSQEK